MSGLEFRDRVSRVRKNPPEDAEHWVLAVFVGICVLILVVVMR